jgi:thiamine pyrophosphokinase
MFEDWLVIANGAIIDKKSLQSYAEGRRVCVCDGAYLTAVSAGLSVDLLLGDFDSIDPKLLQQLQNAKKVKIEYAPDQTKTDLEKAIHYLAGIGANNIMVCQALTGRVDHHLYNLRLLSRLSRLPCSLTLVNQEEKVCFYQDEFVLISGAPGGRISILGFDQATISTAGLAYDVEDFVIGDQKDSVSNHLVRESAVLIIRGKALVVCEQTVQLELITEHELESALSV